MANPESGAMVGPSSRDTRTTTEPRVDHLERVGRARQLGMVADGVVGLVVAEILVATDRVLAAQIVDAIVVLVLVHVGVRSRSRDSRLVAVTAARQSLALVALLRVIAIGLPITEWNPDAATLVIAALTTSMALWFVPKVGLTRRSLFAPGAPRLSIAAVVVGLGLGLAAYGAGVPTNMSDGIDVGTIALATVAAVAVAVSEELLFRAVVQHPLVSLGGRAGVVVCSALFAAMYVGFHSGEVVVVMAVAGLLFGAAVVLDGSLRAAINGHIALSVGAVVVWPLFFGTEERLGTSVWVTLSVLLVLGGAATIVLFVPRRS